MKYYIDTEFLEGKQKESFPISLFRKETPNTIDLISIGIVSEDEREYYAISKDFNLKEAWNRFDLKINKRYPMGPEYLKEYWIRENVLKPIYYDWVVKDINFHEVDFTYKDFKRLLNKYGKPNKQIAEEIKRFVYAPEQVRPMGTDEPIEFYAYYADYDWVVFCWLFGKMIDLPEGFPTYCKDLKQIFDEKTNDLKNNQGIIEIKGSYVESVGAFECFSFNSLKDMPSYPKQENEHNALDDAKWNKKLHEFLNNL